MARFNFRQAPLQQPCAQNRHCMGGAVSYNSAKDTNDYESN